VDKLPTAPPKKHVAWLDRVTGLTREDPASLLAHPQNPKIHPKQQQETLAAAIRDVGYLVPVIVNDRTQHVLDGHMRALQAISEGQTTIPVVHVDVPEELEAEVLLTLDPIAALAVADKANLDALMRQVSSEEAAIQQLFADIAEREGLIAADFTNALGALPSGERSPFENMTFTLTHAQADIVRRALAVAGGAGDFGDTDNANSNGNALARVCEAYDGGR
jgi:ParB-like chromosome segregation protein Spo0J